MSIVQSKMQGVKKAPIVYMAGGMKGAWQDELKRLFPGVMFIDPRNHGCGPDEQLYTAWDLTGVSIADVVFGYLEQSNPAGQGLCVEFGVARAQGKYIVYVEEPRENQRYFGMARAISDEVVTEFYEGVSILAAVLGYNLSNGHKGPQSKEFFELHPEIVYKPKFI